MTGPGETAAAGGTTPAGAANAPSPGISTGAPMVRVAMPNSPTRRSSSQCSSMRGGATRVQPSRRANAVT
jgi:hypothetical protein